MVAAAAALDNPLRVDFCGLEFSSPIVLLSGCVGFGEEYTRIEGFSNRDAGAVVLKGTTGAARLGNPPHRVYETPMGMLNAIGLQNPGAEQVVRRILPQLDFTETRFIANVCGSTIE
jgi:dihydroorotate dehydrogenase (NAD+) catalytic subunit